MKILIKFILLFILSFIAIYFLLLHQIIDIKALKSSFENHKSIILLIAIIQILVCLFMTLRYYSLLKIFNIKTDFQNVLAATFVSNGLGQWMPGSMAFIEIIRIGLMLGADENSSKINYSNKNIEIKDNLEELALKSKLAAISIMDRLIGILVMLVFGIIFTIFIYYKLDLSMHENALRLLDFLIVITTLFLFIVMLPFFSNSRTFRKILTRFERIILNIFRKSLINKLIRKLFHEINSLLDAIVLGCHKLNLFWKPILCSMICVLLTCLAMFLCGIALSNRIPFEAILATISIISLASMIPIGIGGMGGMQIITAAIFSIFHVPPNIASSAQLLQTAISLVTISVSAIFFARLSSRQIRAILLSRKNKQLAQNENILNITDS